MNKRLNNKNKRLNNHLMKETSDNNSQKLPLSYIFRKMAIQKETTPNFLTIILYLGESYEMRGPVSLCATAQETAKSSTSVQGADHCNVQACLRHSLVHTNINKSGILCRYIQGNMTPSKTISNRNLV